MVLPDMSFKGKAGNNKITPNWLFQNILYGFISCYDVLLLSSPLLPLVLYKEDDEDMSMSSLSYTLHTPPVFLFLCWREYFYLFI